jgi:F-type H+-transporting ATPase subunit b
VAVIFNPANAEFWVLAALVIFFGLLVWLKVLPGALFAALDAQTAKIQAELDEARALREEAQALLNSVKTQRDEAEAQAKAMIAAAKDEAKRLEADAKAKLEQTIVRRAALAERKIEAAEAEAAAQVKAAAVDMAAHAAEIVFAGRLAGAKADGLTDKAIDELASKLQ